LPLYEYKCEKCGHVFEKIEPMSAPEVKKCPNCKKGKAVRQLSSSAIQFKGTGWYVTDYAGKKPSSSTSESGESKAASSDGGSAKKDTPAKETAGKAKSKKE
jgi:putative FmdB family regulatory protein